MIKLKPAIQSDLVLGRGTGKGRGSAGAESQPLLLSPPLLSPRDQRFPTVSGMAHGLVFLLSVASVLHSQCPGCV